MARRSSDPVHCWLIWRKAHEAAFDYVYRGIAETGISDTDFRVLEALLHKGPLPVNTIGPKVHLTPGSISVAVDRLLEKGLVSRAESPDDRRVWVVALTKSGKDLIVPIRQVALRWRRNAREPCLPDYIEVYGIAVLGTPGQNRVRRTNPQVNSSVIQSWINGEFRAMNYRRKPR
jgi:MarR family 2-MHQ and catechol resistance regulon transcriptional repressor